MVSHQISRYIVAAGYLSHLSKVFRKVLRNILGYILGAKLRERLGRLDERL